jgi:hypothetical protein
MYGYYKCPKCNEFTMKFNLSALWDWQIKALNNWIISEVAENHISIFVRIFIYKFIW